MASAVSSAPAVSYELANSITAPLPSPVTALPVSYVGKNGKSTKERVGGAPLYSKKAIKKIPGALSVFRWTVKHLYLTDTFQRSLIEQHKISLYAFYKQATVGANDIPAPVDLSLNSLSSDPLASMGSGMMSGVSAITGGLSSLATNVTTVGGLVGGSAAKTVELGTPSVLQWQAWKNLGNMRKDEAVDLFLETVSRINPDFMDTHINHETDEAAGPAFALDGSGQKQLSIREIIIRNGVIRIQALVRGFCGKKRMFMLQAKKRSPQVQQLLSLLLKGIPIYKLPVVSDATDGPLRKRLLKLKMGSTINSSQLGITNSMGLISDHRILLIADIADVRAGMSSFGFKSANSSAARMLSNKCVSIIGSKGTMDIVLNQDSFTRAWFVYSFLLLVESALAIEDIRNRGRLPGAKLRYNPVFIPPGLRYDGSRVSALLEASFGVEEYQGLGRCVLKSLWINRESRRLYLAVMTSKGAENPKGIDIDDICEIRCGQISTAIDSSDAAYYGKLLTIVGSETSLTLALSSTTLRDKLARRLNIFLAVRRRNTLPPCLLSTVCFSPHPNLDNTPPKQIYQTGKPDAGLSLAVHGSAARPVR